MGDIGPLSPLLHVLANLTAWLRAQKVRGAVIGGVAASILGRPRATRDVDAVVLMDTARLESFLASGSQFGFAARIEGAVEFAIRNRVLLLVHVPSETQVDISLGVLPFEQESIARAKRVTVSGISFPLVTAEDLIIMKAVAHRPRDMVDIESVLDTMTNLDLGRIRDWVSQFAAVLESPDILDDLENILSRRMRP
ncbi:MAG TPA: nucleotidyltransferase [Blastocatellia bacterium]|nr:nucleotidyltransferase [Blastocatellia bacterium]